MASKLLEPLLASRENEKPGTVNGGASMLVVNIQYLKLDHRSTIRSQLVIHNNNSTATEMVSSARVA